MKTAPSTHGKRISIHYEPYTPILLDADTAFRLVWSGQVTVTEVTSHP